MKKKCALLDTDFISKLHITRKDDENRMIDRIMEMTDYQFVCHEQIVIELGHHNNSAIIWLLEKITDGTIKKYDDTDLIILLRTFYGENANWMYLNYLNHACSLFGEQFYEQYYMKLEEKANMPYLDFLNEIAKCDTFVGSDNNLGEIKTYLLQQILKDREEVQLYLFFSDDRVARNGLGNVGGIPCISAISAFYLLKEKLGMDGKEARLYFDSWMLLHQARGQTSFKIHRDSKEMQLMKMDGYEIFNRIYNGTMTVLKNGNLMVRSRDS